MLMFLLGTQRVKVSDLADKGLKWSVLAVLDQTGKFLIH